ncbi:MAG TPA: hypothetical protein VLK35_18560 [Methylomirabilota bacterium]|nr:hypothetical protein [Methylomirabilota bacterium]
MSEAGTRFGWIIRPRLAPAVEGGGRSFRQTPGFYPLSAIVSVPSWWRRLRIEVDAGWVNPNSSWFAPQGFAADLLAARSEECSARPSCQVSRPRVPGSVKEIKEKLRYEVRKEPYIDFEATAQNQFLEIGRPGEVVLEGGRLWRSTIVRMGHQQADRIIVLPDMKGIIAEFACVEPPPGVAGLSDPAASVAADPRLTDGPAPGAFDPRLYVPVHVWTSEGRTALPLHVALRPFVTRKVSQGDDASYLKPPCFLGNGTSLGQGSADRTGQPVTGGPRNAGG